jgi:hypothetical protein
MPASQVAYIPVETTRDNWRPGGWSTWNDTLDRASLVVFPQLYYPGLLVVQVDGRPTAYGNVGRLVALELPAGRHQVRMSFAGVRWANVISAIAWIAMPLLFVPAIMRSTRLRHRRDRLVGGQDPSANAGGRAVPRGAAANLQKGIV